jgi:hypothetical protein
MAQAAKPSGPQRLCILLDGTAGMANHIGDIRKEVLETLFNFLGRAAQFFNLVEFALVVYRTRDPFSEAVISSSSWQPWSIRALDAMLGAVQFMGGGCGEAALAEALAQAAYLHTCPVNPALLAGLPNLKHDMPKACHVLLITATASSRLPVPSAPPQPQPQASYKELLRGLKAQHITLSAVSTRDWGHAASTRNLFFTALGLELPQQDEASLEKYKRSVDEQFKFGFFSRCARAAAALLQCCCSAAAAPLRRCCSAAAVRPPRRCSARRANAPLQRPPDPASPPPPRAPACPRRPLAASPAGSTSTSRPPSPWASRCCRP